MDQITAASPFNGIPSYFFMGVHDAIIANSLTQQAADEFTSPVVVTDPNVGHTLP